MDYYEILGVSPNASDAVIRVAYRQRLKEVHPDHGHDDEQAFADVLEAGSVLLKPAKRVDYDEQRNVKARQAEERAHRAEHLASNVSVQDRTPRPTSPDVDMPRPTGVAFRRAVAGVVALVSLVAIVLMTRAIDTGDEVLASSIATLPVAGSTETAVPTEVSLADEVAPAPTEVVATEDAVPAPTEVVATEDAVPAPTEVVATEDAVPAPTEVPPTPAPTAVTTPTAVATASPTPEPTAASVGETSESAVDSTDSDDSDDSLLPDLADLPERGAIYRPPTLFLVGPVPSQEIADEFYGKAIAVVGEENVINEYVVHPDAPLDLNGNVRVERAIVFETNSAEIRDPFVPILGLALEVLLKNPQATLIVEGHTDSDGNREQNQILSQRRADAVVAWLIGQGIEADRIQAVGFGEQQPVADNATADGRAINRRIEFQIINLLG